MDRRNFMKSIAAGLVLGSDVLLHSLKSKTEFNDGDTLSDENWLVIDKNIRNHFGLPTSDVRHKDNPVDVIRENGCPNFDPDGSMRAHCEELVEISKPSFHYGKVSGITDLRINNQPIDDFDEVVISKKDQDHCDIIILDDLSEPLPPNAKSNFEAVNARMNKILSQRKAPNNIIIIDDPEITNNE